jgi:hypothetical protein
MTVEILNFTEALRLTDTGKRIINKNIERKAVRESNDSN